MAVENKTKLIVLGSVLAVLAAVAVWMWLPGSPPKQERTKIDKAAARQQQIQSAQQTAGSDKPPPEITRPTRKGAVGVDGKR